MATSITFSIPNNQLKRISDAIGGLPEYKYDPSLGTTQAQQREAFFKQMTRVHWQSIVFNYERQLAIDAEPLDTAAEQAKRFNDLSDITTN